MFTLSITDVYFTLFLFYLKDSFYLQRCDILLPVSTHLIFFDFLFGLWKYSLISLVFTIRRYKRAKPYPNVYLSLAYFEVKARSLFPEA